MAEKIEKQNYLKENILQAGYDAALFGLFMAEQRDDGTDINNWTYDELVTLVKEFKDLQDSSTKNEPGDKQPKGDSSKDASSKKGKCA